MTGDNMKSDFVESSRGKIEGRQSIHRRKMNKSSGVFENGGDSDKTLSNQESLKYSKQQTTDRQKEAANRTGDMGDNHLTLEDLETKNGDTHETKQLKELLLVHLDLIQQQQELLLAKDRQIQTLRSERDTVRRHLKNL